MKRITLMLLLAAGLASAKEPWQKIDTALASAYWATHVVDWAQTLDIQNHPGLRETNPLLGKHPSRAEINRHFLYTGLAHLALEMTLPPRWRRPFEGATIALNLHCIQGNIQLGLRATF